MATKTTVVLASPLEVAAACRALLVQEIQKAELSVGQLNGWLPSTEVNERMTCNRCNLTRGVTEDLVYELGPDGVMCVTHAKCMGREDLPTTRDAALIARHFKKQFPDVFSKRRDLIRSAPRPEPAPVEPKKKSPKKAPKKGRDKKRRKGRHLPAHAHH